ncbi:MAG: glycosyltransferase family 39 protein [Anaerolineales bacterium]|nr:glycosyltransferase family 39 protein [Anaerolineales bacterium]
MNHRSPLPAFRSAQAEKALLVLLTLLAFGLRVWQLDAVPPGWRDDELINSLVISQKVLDGDWQLYYADASGHEALYHALNAIFLGLFGPTAPGIRLLSAFLGTLAVPLTYLLGRRLFGRATGLVAALGLSLSFWSLMYSRIGLRHVLLPLLVLAGFYFFWGALTTLDERRGRRQALAAALWIALGFYTYFAGRGVPLVLLAFAAVIWLTARDLFRRQWRRWLLLGGALVLLALPLAIALQQQPTAEGRVAELAVPVVEARAGNFAPLWEHVTVTLSMFHSRGDGEWLYNVPDRPLFGLPGAVMFWAGVALALWQALAPLRRRRPAGAGTAVPPHLPAAFLLLWWLAGISPAFLSVPPASLGHTIMAQPAVYLLAALPVGALAQNNRLTARIAYYVWRIRDTIRNTQHAIRPPTRLAASTRVTMALLLAALLLGSIALRDLPDYFEAWPRRGMVRFLYRADIHDVADYLNAHPELTDFGISGLLAGPWDKLALQIALDNPTAVSPRWYNPERALLLQPAANFSGWPGVPAAYADWITPSPVQLGAFRLGQVTRQTPPAANEPVCFTNGLCLVSAVYDAQTQVLALGWWVKRPLDLPEMPLISNPPPPGVYSGPRLAAFGQLLDASGRFLAGDDGLWVDPYTLQPGDRFVQQHWPRPPAGSTPHAALIGLYDPFTGARILTTDGADHVRLELAE